MKIFFSSKLERQSRETEEPPVADLCVDERVIDTSA